MGIKAVPHVDMNCLGILAAYSGRPNGVVGPLRANVKETIIPPHFGMRELSILVRDYHATLKAERFLQPIQCGPWIAIEQGGDYAGASKPIVHGVTVTAIGEAQRAEVGACLRLHPAGSRQSPTIGSNRSL
jgi:hypothetical protein